MNVPLIETIGLSLPLSIGSLNKQNCMIVVVNGLV